MAENRARASVSDTPGSGAAGTAARAAATRKLNMWPRYPIPAKLRAWCRRWFGWPPAAIRRGGDSTTISCTVRSLATLVLCCAVLTLLPLPTSTAQQRASLQGRVVIDTPSTAKRPTSAYPNRAVTVVTLAPPTEVRNVVVFLKDAPARAVSPTRVGIRERHETF